MRPFDWMLEERARSAGIIFFGAERDGDSLQHHIYTRAHTHTLTAPGWQWAVSFGVLGFGCLCNGRTYKSAPSHPHFINPF